MRLAELMARTETRPPTTQDARPTPAPTGPEIRGIAVDSRAVGPGFLFAALPASAEVIRHKTPGSTFPILRASEVPSGTTVVYLSGMCIVIKSSV